MRSVAATLILLTLALLAACAPRPVRPAINSVSFERRSPPPSQPGYLETIKYIDDGMRYISPAASFFVSPIGEMCFYGAITPGITPEFVRPNYWCISPFAVKSIDANENNISYVNQVRLWCRIATPQCAHRIGYPDLFETIWIANSIAAETIPFQRQRDAIEYLVYLMGGDAGRAQAMQ